ncbi:hypothetical protein VP01_582g3 [Puccinia sorghi]|uniref:Uncharacterized protein n=1 Tax=Puccinia sorghi TaxID=27349 RepID=A0A0L6UI21_9BASI|nr:hypothetical protein VP01_582g3 [Puccinia sorghi]
MATYQTPWIRSYTPPLATIKMFDNKTLKGYYLCGFYIKQSHGPVLKTHIFEQPFTTVNLDQICSNRNGLQHLGVNFILLCDVWTTKGNCFGLIGASVSFIYNDWKDIVQHLSLNFFAWHHKQFVAEPSQCICKAWPSKKDKKMHQKLHTPKGSELSWDCNTMHIKCFCHKMGLVENAALKKLSLEAPPPPNSRRLFLDLLPNQIT